LKTTLSFLTGLLESDHVERVVQNYNLIYKLGLPSHDVTEYIKLNSVTKTTDLRLFIHTDSFLNHLANSYFHFMH